MYDAACKYLQAAFKGIEMKIALFALLTVLSSTAWSQSCELPAAQIKVANIGLGQSFTQFKQGHPSAAKSSFGKDAVHIEFKNRQGHSDSTDTVLEKQGVTSAMHIALNPQTDRIVSYALNFSEGPLADFNTPLDTFKQRLQQRFNLPKQGWKKQDNSYVYRCTDYIIDIQQDHGDGRQALGASVLVISKDSDMFNDN